MSIPAEHGGTNLFLRGKVAAPSEMERRMMSVMGGDDDSEGDEDVDDDDEGNEGRVGAEETRESAFLTKLPIELIDRILTHAILDDRGEEDREEGNGDGDRANPDGNDTDKAQAGSRSTLQTQTAFKRRRLSEQASSSLCLVSRQFDRYARGKMYGSVQITTARKMRPFLRSMRENERLAGMVHDLTLDSKIWTDVDENVIAGIFLAVRKHCRRVKVGANESPLLPYLFQGQWKPSSTTDQGQGVDVSEGEQEEEEEEVTEREQKVESIPLQSLHICWRDEVEYTNVRQERGREEESTQQSSSSDSFRRLFQHATFRLSDSPASRQICPDLSHLTIDLYSQDQLCQLFDRSGFFVQDILPLLSFLRIELPYIVLQFKCENRGDLVHGWPTDDWRVASGRVVEEAIQDRQVQIARRRSSTASVAAIVTTSATTATSDSAQIFDGTAARETDDGTITMPFCPSNQLKTLLLRFLLNVHRNDMTLFKLLIPAEALEHSWSTRASITAQCLSSTMQMHLNQSLVTPPPRDGSAMAGLGQLEESVTFPLADFNKKKVDGYWRSKWAEAHRDYVSSMPTASSSSISPTHNGVDAKPWSTRSSGGDSIKVSLLLRWPNAVDAFYYFSAMV